MTPMCRRVKTEISMKELENELLQQNWDMIYRLNDTNEAYDTFLSIYKTLNDKTFLIKQYYRSKKYKDNQWMSNGLKTLVKRKTYYIENL